MADELKASADTSAKLDPKPNRISDEAIEYMNFFGGEIVSPARVTLYTNNKGEPDFKIVLLPELLTVRQAAKALAVSETTVRRLLKQGKLAKCQVGRATSVRWESVTALMKG